MVIIAVIFSTLQMHDQLDSLLGSHLNTKEQRIEYNGRLLFGYKMTLAFATIAVVCDCVYLTFIA